MLVGGPAKQAVGCATERFASPLVIYLETGGMEGETKTFKD